MMKKILSVVIFICILSAQINAQTKPNQRTPILGQTVPSFSGISTMGTINFPDDYWDQWKIIFSHPADFTAVCSTEILELAAMQDEFKKLNTAIVVISTDGLNSHMEWIHSLESIKTDGKTIPAIKFPLISDADLTISRSYGMIQEESYMQKRDIRAVFIIDPNNKLCATFAYPNNIGRNMNEIKRTLIALQTSYVNHVLIPANWTPGDDVLVQSPVSIEDSRNMEKNNDDKLYSKAWYLWFRKLPMDKKGY